MIRVLLLIAALGVPADPAGAATRFEIIDDCADDSRLQGRYTIGELRDARRNMRTEAAEYTDCADVLRRAELALVEGSGGEEDAATTGGGTGEPAAPPAEPPAPADDSERAALDAARAQGAAPVALRGREIKPGGAGFTTGAVRNEMPGSLLGVVIALALGMTAVLGAARRGFVPMRGGEAMRNDPWRPIP